MPKASRSSISRKLIWTNMVVSGAVLLFACVALMAYDLITFRDAVARNLSIQAGIIGSNSISALLFDDEDTARQTLTPLKDAPSIVSARIYARNGSLFAEYRSPLSSATVSPPSLPPDQTEAVLYEGNQIGLIRRIVFEGKPVGAVYIQSDIAELMDRLQHYGMIVGAVLLLAMCAGFPIARRAQRTISRPIEELAEVSRRVSTEEDYSIRAPSTGSRDEIDVLVSAFNEMLGRIQQHDRSLRDAHDLLETRVRDRTAELKAANKELEAFSYSVSHDLRAPLRHVVGFAGLLEQHAGSQLDDRNRRYLKTVSDAALRMGRLIDDLLAFSRTGRADLKKQRVSLSDLILDARAEVAAEAADRSITWNVGTLPDVNADPSLLRLAIINLLSNAVKYTKTKPSAQIDIGIQTPINGEVVVFVRDNGVGFDMKYVNKLFGVFQRLHGNEFAGTGIGLANVHRIVNRHGGRTWAEGEVGHGATFYFSLPDAEACKEAELLSASV